MSSKSNNNSGFDKAIHTIEGGVVAYECYKNPEKVSNLSPIALAKIFVVAVEAVVVIARTLYDIGSDVVHLAKGDSITFEDSGESDNFFSKAWGRTDSSYMGDMSHEFKENGSFGKAIATDLAAGVETIGSCVFEALDIIGDNGSESLGAHLAA